jgi:hypothetical protein
LLQSFQSPLLGFIELRRSSQPAADIFCKIMKIIISFPVDEDLIGDLPDKNGIFFLREG